MGRGRDTAPGFRPNVTLTLICGFFTRAGFMYLSVPFGSIAVKETNEE